MRAPTMLLLALSMAATHLHAASGAESLKSVMGIINTKGRMVDLDPSVQHIPLDASLSHLRPPPARVPDSYDIFVGLSVFRDGFRCAYTMFTGFTRATNPDGLYFGVVDQVNPGDLKCIDEFCKMAEAQWPEKGACPYKDHIRIDERLADDSRGPTLARHYQQKLLRDQEFCLQLDGHSVFTKNWDTNIVNEWKRIDNDMALLTTYLHDMHDFVDAEGNNKIPNSLPHLCTTVRGGNGLVRNEGASMITNPKWPQMSALWGAGLSFSKCHAERRVLIDSHTLWMFDGEEFLRASHLWTHGYDLYSPSKLGAVVYHNYTKVPARFEHVSVDQDQKALEKERGKNRFKLIVGKPFVGEVDTREMDKFAFGKVRSFQEYLQFSGVTFEDGKNDTDTCRQLHWVPYSNATEVEAIVGGGWTLHPERALAPAVAAAGGGGDARAPGQHEPDAPVEPVALEKHAQAGALHDGEHVETAVENKAENKAAAGGVPGPTDKPGLGGLVFYFVMFAGVLYVVLANEGVAWNVSNLWRSNKPLDSHKL